jgi:hypothetical protein
MDDERTSVLAEAWPSPLLDLVAGTLHEIGSNVLQILLSGKNVTSLGGQQIESILDLFNRLYHRL